MKLRNFHMVLMTYFQRIQGEQDLLIDNTLGSNNDCLTYKIPKELHSHVTRLNFITFAVRSCQNVYISLINGDSSNDELYEIVLGGNYNSNSFIRIEHSFIASIVSNSVLHCGKFKEFWIRWDKYNINVGQGSKVNQSIFLTFEGEKGKELHPVKNIGYCTGTGTTGQFQFHKSVNGGWSDWSQWSSCSVTCGKGRKSMSRTCTNPSPQYSGKPCIGNLKSEGDCKFPCLTTTTTPTSIQTYTTASTARQQETATPTNIQTYSTASTARQQETVTPSNIQTYTTASTARQQETATPTNIQTYTTAPIARQQETATPSNIQTYTTTSTARQQEHISIPFEFSKDSMATITDGFKTSTGDTAITLTSDDKNPSLNGCECPCPEGTGPEIPMSKVERDILLHDEMEKVKSTLQIPKKQLSKYIRTKVSAPDPRKSSQYIGMVGIIVIVIPMVILVLSDLSRCFC